jgi:YVTN family beta-propeller protein
LNFKKLLTVPFLTGILFLSACALEEGNNNGNDNDSAGNQTDSAAADLTSVQFYVPSEDDNLISVIDVVSGENVAEIETSAAPTFVTFASTMREAFVANQDSGTVEIINTQQLESIAEIEVGPRPHGLALSNDNNTLYVATVGDQYVDVIDVGEEEVSSQIDLGSGAYSNYVHLVDDQLYVTDHENDAVYIVDIETQEVTDVIETGGTPRVVREHKGMLYVAASETGALEIIDIETLEKEIIDVGIGATDMIIDENGEFAIVTSVEENFVARVDLASGEVTDQIQDQEGAKHLAFNREESRVYVTLSGSNEVSVINVASFEEETRIEVGNTPHGIDIKALPGIGGSC